jgi:hypothetical protein
MRIGNEITLIVTAFSNEPLNHKFSTKGRKFLTSRSTSKSEAEIFITELVISVI